MLAFGIEDVPIKTPSRFTKMSKPELRWCPARAQQRARADLRPGHDLRGPIDEFIVRITQFRSSGLQLPTDVADGDQPGQGSRDGSQKSGDRSCLSEC